MGRKLAAILITAAVVLTVFTACSDTMLDDVKEKINQDRIESGEISSYSIIYNGNGNTLGEVPVDDKLYITGSMAVVLANVNGLIRQGFTFSGWNTAADGSGTSYVADDIITVGTADVLLFAEWTANIYTITFDKNDNDATGTMAEQHIACESTAALYSCQFEKTDWTCIGWSLTPDGNIAYANEADITMGASDLTLYAKWVEGYSVKFYKNDAAASGEMADQIIGKNTDANLNPCSYTKTGWSFNGWAIEPTGGVVYQDGESFHMGIADVPLYAKWVSNDYTVSFDSGGGSAAADITVTYDSEYGTLPVSSLAGYTFSGWWNSPGGTGTEITDTTIVNTADNHTLYARWLSQAKSIGSFEFTLPAATGIINEIAKSISVTVPYNTDRSSLVPTIVHTGSDISPSSGVANDFTSVVTYTVTAEDSSSQNYDVTVSRLPGVTTAAVTSITSSTASCGGNVTDQAEGGAVTTRGVCWSTSTAPTTADSLTEDGSGTGVFASSLTGLFLNTTYYVRSYAVNNLGTSYGDQIVFSTNLPEISTSEAADITGDGASVEVNISTEGGSPVTARGVCWSTSSAPTTSDSVTNDGTGGGVFTSTITGLAAGSTYYVRSYATSNIGTVYGNEISFTAQTLPSVTTSSVSGITGYGASGGGNVTSSGTSSVTAYGICWSTSEFPTVSDSKTTDGSGTGSFVSGISGLTPATAYYVRAYATSSAGTAYGSQTSFTTLDYPTVSTASISGITTSSASSGGNVAFDGGASISARGVCWSTSSNPTTSNAKTSDGTGSGTFTSNITGLTSGNTYYVRAYATNSVGTSYGNQVSFTTLALPTVTTTSVTNITSSGASSGGNVTSDGGASVTSRGVCWSTTSNPTTANSKTINGTGTGSYTSNITGISIGTTYYVRAYAVNSVGTAYGLQTSFTPTLPSVSTTAIVGNTGLTVDIGGTVGSGGGNVTSQGSSTVTERGICWNTAGNPTTSNSKASSGTGTGSFTASMTGLSTNTVYYVRAYATSSVGTVYGSQVSFNSGYAFNASHAGGIVFYNNGSGGGMVTSGASAIGSVIYYSNVTSTLIGSSAQGTGFGSGAGNTSAIINQTGHTNSAAKVCSDLVYGGYSDWYLPSRDEGRALVLVIAPGHVIQSSTEVSATNYYRIGWSGDPTSLAKSTSGYVHAVRDF